MCESREIEEVEKYYINWAELYSKKLVIRRKLGIGYTLPVATND